MALFLEKFGYFLSEFFNTMSASTLVIFVVFVFAGCFIIDFIHSMVWR